VNPRDARTAWASRIFSRGVYAAASSLEGFVPLGEELEGAGAVWVRSKVKVPVCEIEIVVSFRVGPNKSGERNVPIVEC